MWKFLLSFLRWLFELSCWGLDFDNQVNAHLEDVIVLI